MAGHHSRASLRSAADDFDELYQGFDEASLQDTQKQVAEDAILQRVIQSSRSGQADNGQAGIRMRPESRLGVQTAKVIGRRPTGQQLLSASKNDMFRPASSIRGAGYTAKSGRSTSGSSGVGSPSGRLSSGTPVMVPSLEPGQSDNDQPSKRALTDFRVWEKELTAILDQIAVLVLENSPQKALGKMKDCFKIRKRLLEIEDWSTADKEHHLRPLLAKLGWYQAEVLTACSKYDEAVTVHNNLLETSSTASKEEQAAILFRIIVLHRRRGAHQTALTFLHRLLDDLPGDSGHLRVSALNEAAACHVQLGRWDTAYKYCQMILQDAPYSAKAAFNSLVALAAMKAPDNKIQQAYSKLLSVQPPVSPDKRPSSSGQPGADQLANTNLRLFPKFQMEHYVTYIRNASQLMAHRNPDVIAGYDQCIEELNKSNWAATVIPALEMAKALLYLEQQDLPKAMEILSSHDRDEEEDIFRSQYCDLLCFLTFHRNNMQEARELAKRSYASNKLSLQACTNLGSVEYAEANFAEALHYFQEAAMLNSADFRSSYYAGMALKGLGNQQDAMSIFQKLYNTHGQRPTVLFQIAQLYEEAEQFAEAFAFFEKIFALYPGEPLVLQRLGQLAYKLGDTGAALWYYNESHRVCRTNLEVLNWLGRFFVTSQFPEKAIAYFGQAADIEPQTAKWGLLMANAMRRAGHLTDAYSTFVDLHQRFPDNIDCLKLLIRMSQELQVAPSDIAKYQKELQFLSRQGSSTETAPVSRSSTTSTAHVFGDGRLTTGRKASSGFSTADYSSLKNVNLDLDDSDLAAFAEVRPSTASIKNLSKLARPPTGKSKPVQDDEDIATTGLLPGFPSHK